MNNDLETLRINHDESFMGKRERKSKIPKGIIVILLIIGIVSVNIVIFNWKFSNKIEEVKGRSAIVQGEEISTTILTVGGYVESLNEVTVSAKITGKIELLTVEEGDFIKRGEIIAKLDDEQLQAQLNQNKANLLIAHAWKREVVANLSNAEINLRRTKTLYDNGAVAKQELDVVQTQHDTILAQYQSAEAQIYQNQASLNLIKLQLDDTIIKSPISGVVVRKFVNQGEIINPQAFQLGAAIITIIDPKRLRIWADVNETDIAKIKIGQSVRIVPDALPDQVYKGKISKIMPSADRQKNTIEVKISIINPDKLLKPEMTVKITIMRESL